MFGDEVLHTDEAGNQLKRDSRGRVYGTNAEGKMVNSKALGTLLKRSGTSTRGYFKQGGKEYYKVQKKNDSDYVFHLF